MEEFFEEEDLDEDMELRVKALIALHHEAFKRRALYPHIGLPRPNLLYLLPRKHLGRAKIYRSNPLVQLPQYFKDRPNPGAPDRAQIVEQDDDYIIKTEAIENEITAFEEVGIEEWASSLAVREEIEAEECELVSDEEQEDAPDKLDPILPRQEPLVSEPVEQILAEQSLDSDPDVLCPDPFEIEPEDEIEGF
jgi:hypothetical protein